MLHAVSEFEIIHRYFARHQSDESVRVGIGDDAAILRPAAGRDIICCVDTLISDVHFPDSLPAADIGYRCVAVNLSDIAAMAGRPRWMTLALTLRNSHPTWLAEFASGLFAAADEYGLQLVGGDTTRGGETVISIQMIGDVEMDKALTRCGASPGDKIFVTGTQGDAAGGLAVLQSGVVRDNDADYLVRRFSRPAARVAIGQVLGNYATAAIDVSDGLYADTCKLLAASSVAGTIELADIPLSSALKNIMGDDDALRFALGGGDDYELCFTSSVPPAELQEIASRHAVSITAIGQVMGDLDSADDSGGRLKCTRDGKAYDYRHDGYRHFN